ncbi:hypothetical protein MJD09_06650 [bacterium]|nr:hypothetical protein [bacterium]
MAQITLAANEKAFRKLYERVRDAFEFTASDSGDFGPFSAGYDIKTTLEGGDVDLRADNTVKIDELDIKWDKLDFHLGLDLPRICVGGFCIVPNPFGGCLVRAPRICVFGADPDISITLPLGGIVTSEISFTGSLYFKYFINSARPIGMDDWEAAESSPSLANKWQLFIDPESIDLDVFDIADTVGDLLEDAVDLAIDGLLGPLPGWAKDIIRAILGPIIDLIRGILDIADDVEEWLSDILNVSFGLLDLVLTFVAEYFANRSPLFEFEDPYSVLKEADNPNTLSDLPKLVPVKIPVRDLQVANDDKEMVIEANIG